MTKPILLSAIALALLATQPASAQFSPQAMQQWQSQGASPGEAFANSFRGPPPQNYGERVPYQGYLQPQQPSSDGYGIPSNPYNDPHQ